MKKGLTLTELAAKVEAQAAQKVDLLADTRNVRVVFDQERQPKLKIEGTSLGMMEISDYAHGQIAAKTNIPKKFYDRIMEKYPDVYKMCVNAIFVAESERRMIRTLGGKVRALVSDKYRRLDNEHLLLLGILPALQNNQLGHEIEIASSQITETHLYLQVGVPSMKAEIVPGDTIHTGFMVRNSEVGASSLGVYPFFTRLVCKNGMVMTSLGKRKFHVGRTIEETESVHLFSDETLRADDKAFFLKVRDMIRACITQEAFDDMVQSMRDAAAKEVSVESAPKILESSFNLLKHEASMAQQIMQINMERDGSNFWSMSNAVTQLANQTEDYDRAMELQVIGGRIVAEARA